MKLLFLCTSLESGRDGVGDYTRLLADACLRRGHVCQIIALHDPFVKTSQREASVLPALRLPADMPWDQKAAAARESIEEFSPDWLSWQIVSYGFHPKGILPEEALPLAQLGAGRRNHVMLHELWIGLSRGEPLKNRVWGRLQRRALDRFLEKTGALVLHTTNAAYQQALEQSGWHAAVLPLFGNIPFDRNGHDRPPRDPKVWTAAVFGTVHPQFTPEPCFGKLASGAEISGRRLRLLGIGRLGEHGEKMFAQLARDYAGRMEVSVVGEKSPAEVSHLLQSLDFGIGTHPWALAGKSGAIAAMLDHGLPVVVPREDWVLRRHPRSIPSLNPLMIRLSEMPPELMAGRLATRHPPAPRLDVVAELFLSCLQAASAGPVAEP